MPTLLRNLALVWLWSLAATCGAVEYPNKAHDPLMLLPVLASTPWTPCSAPPEGQPIMADSHALRSVAGKVVLLDTVLNMDKGPEDGMEVLACMEDGKTHEALVRTEFAGIQGRYLKFACISALALKDGTGANEFSGVPARGTPVRMRIYWHDDDTWKCIDASCLIRDRDMDRGYPPLPFVYTGSRSIAGLQNDPSGKPVKVNRFMLEDTRSIAVVFDEPDALIASPFPGTKENARFEANSSLTPPVGTKLVLAIERAQLPLTLIADEHGALSYQGKPLPDAELVKLLGATYPPVMPPDSLRAVDIQLPPTTEHEVDVNLRTQILAAAALAKAWVVPVFTTISE
jgi:hypothetical protein